MQPFLFSTLNNSGALYDTVPQEQVLLLLSIAAVLFAAGILLLRPKNSAASLAAPKPRHA